MKGKLFFLVGFISLGCLYKSEEKESNFLVREIRETSIQTNNFFENNFDDYKIDFAENNVEFNGSLRCKLEPNSTVSNTSFDNLSSVIPIRYNIRFCEETMKFYCKIYSNKECDNILLCTIESDAFINEKGHLDSYVELDDGHGFYISDFEKNGFIDNCGFF